METELRINIKLNTFKDKEVAVADLRYWLDMVINNINQFSDFRVCETKVKTVRNHAKQSKSK